METGGGGLSQTDLAISIKQIPPVIDQSPNRSSTHMEQGEAETDWQSKLWDIWQMDGLVLKQIATIHIL